MIKKMANFLVNTKLWISLCAVCMVLTTYLVLNLACGLITLIIIFCGTFLIYNISSLPYQRHSTFISLWVLRSMWGACLLFCLIAFFLLDTASQLLLGHLGMLSMFYFIPFDETKWSRYSLRNIPFLKIFLISYVWAMATVLLPALENDAITNQHKVWMLVAERFLFILGITIPFDIRDFIKDKRNNLTTIPIAIGIRYSKLMSIFALAGCVVLMYLQSGFGEIFLVQLLSIALLTITISAVTKKSNINTFSFMIDGMMIFQYLLLILVCQFAKFSAG